MWGPRPARNLRLLSNLVLKERSINDESLVKTLERPTETCRSAHNGVLVSVCALAGHWGIQDLWRLAFLQISAGILPSTDPLSLHATMISILYVAWISGNASGLMTRIHILAPRAPKNDFQTPIDLIFFWAFVLGLFSFFSSPTLNHHQFAHHPFSSPPSCDNYIEWQLRIFLLNIVQIGIPSVHHHLHRLNKHATSNGSCARFWNNIQHTMSYQLVIDWLCLIPIYLLRRHLGRLYRMVSDC